jgi:hypothetical protein
MARPPADINWATVDQYLHAQCDGVAIAGIIGIAPDTLYHRCQQDHNLGFSEYSQQKKTEGRELLRQKQFDTAMSGDKTMLVWLGKQYLEQKERHDITTKDDKLTANNVFRFEIIDPVKQDVDQDKSETGAVSDE